MIGIDRCPVLKRMEKQRVRFTEEKATMLATLYGRALDSRSPDAILGDRASDEAVRNIDYDFRKLKVGKDAAISICMRAKYFDRWTREFLTHNPESNVLHLGCGLDTRIYRLDPPSNVRWYDLDYPQTIELRRRLYPERDGYRMIPSSVTDLRWLEGIPPDRPTMMVAEGLTPYLTKPDVVRLLDGIARRFSSGQFAFDAVSRLGAKLSTRFQPSVRAAGATLSFGIDDPREVETWIPGVSLVTALDVSAFSDAPEVARFSLPYRMMMRVVEAVPALRNMGLLLRYRW